ncbi:hypothetical protein MKX08_005890 [Trichoderma sp. CBMAI-0020]|nr:hypothetical protein MKX08_005890 [Trichoderma sp. CBMAI-0020]
MTPGQVDTIYDAEHVKGRHVGAKAPEEEGADRRAKGRDCNAGRHMETISQAAHDDAPYDCSNVQDQERQSRREIASTESSTSICRQIDAWKEVTDAFDNIRELEQAERWGQQELEVERVEVCARSRHPWLDEQNQGCGQDKDAERPYPQCGSEPVLVEEKLQKKGNGKTTKTAARPHGAVGHSFAFDKPFVNIQDTGAVTDGTANSV